jgi:hypothetical protein
MELPRIEKSAQDSLSQDLVGLLGSTSLLIVSGRPLFVIGKDKEIYYNQTIMEYNLPLRITYVAMTSTPYSGHHHLEKVFIGEYPVIDGIGQEDDNLYRFGVRPRLEFGWRSQ